MSEESDWLESLKVGDEVALNHFNGRWVIGKVIQLGKGKGRRFKIEYGRTQLDQMWLNSDGSAMDGDYHFAHIERLTDRIREDVAKENLRRRVISKANRLVRDDMKRLSLEELRSIEGLLDLIHDLLPKVG